METQSVSHREFGTFRGHRSKLEKEGRIVSTNRWLYRAAIAGGIIMRGVATGSILGFYDSPITTYSEMSRIALQNLALLGGAVIMTSGLYGSAEFANRIAIWESRMNAFKQTFPSERIHLIPESFHPRGLVIHPPGVLG